MSIFNDLIYKMHVSQENIKLARFITRLLGIEPKVYPYFDNDMAPKILSTCSSYIFK